VVVEPEVEVLVAEAMEEEAREAGPKQRDFRQTKRQMEESMGSIRAHQEDKPMGGRLHSFGSEHPVLVRSR
jgi:hypothetical protein